jgi:hypothetical protein
LDSPRQRDHRRVDDAWNVGRDLEDAHEFLASKAPIAVCRPIGLRDRLPDTISRDCELVLESKGIVGLIAAAANLWD